MSIYDRLREEKEIVGFAGKKRSGKDTAADAIANRGYKPIAFAAPIKDTCQNVFRFSDDHLDGSKKEEVDDFWGFSPRWAMQMIGTELFRDHIDKNVWVKSLLARIDESNHDRWAVTDVRFPNEVDKLEKAGAEVVYIRRPQKEPDLQPMKLWIAKQGGLVKKAASVFTEFGSEYHASEISLDDHPVTNGADIINNGTVDEFCEAVRYYIKETEKEKSDLVEWGQIYATGR